MSAPGGCGIPACTEADPPPVNRMTDRCKNITLATTSLRPVITQMVLRISKSACETILKERPRLCDRYRNGNDYHVGRGLKVNLQLTRVEFFFEAIFAFAPIETNP